jgi:hypothetical protein
MHHPSLFVYGEPKMSIHRLHHRLFLNPAVFVVGLESIVILSN